MSTLVSRASGNFTAAATWEVAAAGSGASQLVHTSFSGITTSYVFGTAFTITVGQNLTGLLLFVNVNGTGATISGTVSVVLSEDGVALTREVTIDMADLADYTVGWTFFKFATPLASTGVATYKVGVKHSVGGFGVGGWHNGSTNWARVVTTDATAAPAAGDVLFIAGEHVSAGVFTNHVVTMNNATTTAFGNTEICSRGTLNFDPSIDTTLRLAGDLTVNMPSAYLVIGDPAGTAIPRAKVAILEFDCGSDGQYGLLCSYGNIKTCGESRTSGKNVIQTKLTALAAVAATSLSVADDTGWLNGDEVVIAASYRIYSESDKVALTAGAGASTLTVAALTFQHDGTSPVQAEVVLLTHNVKIRSTSSTFMTYVSVRDYGKMTSRWTEIYYAGSNTSNPKDSALDLQNLLATASGSHLPGNVDLKFVSLHDGDNSGIRHTGGNITLEDVVLARFGLSGSSCIGLGVSNGSVTPFTNNWNPIIRRVTLLHVANVFTGALIAVPSVLEDLVVAGINATPFGLSGLGIGLPAAIGAITLHSAAASPTISSAKGAGLVQTVFSSIKVYRINSGSLVFSGTWRLAVNAFEIFGNVTGGICLEQSNYDLVFRNGSCAGEAVVFTTPSGLIIGPQFGSNTGVNRNIRFENCDFGIAGGLKTTHTTADINVRSGIGFYQIYFDHCRFGSATEVTGAFISLAGSPAHMGSGLFFMNKDQVVGDHRAILPWMGTRLRNTSVLSGSDAWSEELQFNSTHGSTVTMFESAPRRIEAPSGSSFTISVQVRKTAAYNGAQPRLLLRSSFVGGITETVLDTMSVGADTWETLTGATGTTTADCVLELVVQAFGTLGSAYVAQDWVVA